MKIKNLFLIIFLAGLVFSCVESVSDTTGSSSSAPTITVNSPKTNDSIHVGTTPISYTASEGAGGTGLSYYELYLNDIYYKKFIQNTDGTNPTISLEFDSTYIHKTFSYYLKVYSKSGKSAKSLVQSNIYILNSPPKAPSNLNIGAYNNSSIILKWTDNSNNETGFELWRSDITDRAYKVLGTNVISYIDLNVSPIADYSYKVRAFNEGGKSAFSNEVSTSSISGGSWNLQAESWGPNVVHLSWVDFVANESGFEIQRLDPGATDFVSLVPLVGPNTTSYDDNGRASSTTYSYRIRYFIAPSTLSGFSNIVTITTIWNINPPTINSSGTDVTGMYIDWTDASNSQAVGTIIERSDYITPRNFIEVGRVSSSKGPWYLINDSIPPSAKVSGNTYYYRVRQIINLANQQFTAPSNEYSIQWP
jgi:hypothetical protein